jgi:predicted alpha/beta-fold hydrolase
MLQEPWLREYGVDLKKVITEMKYLHELDLNCTSIVNGFGTLENYYDKASCVHRVPNIRVPTFIMFALDDPIIG